MRVAHLTQYDAYGERIGESVTVELAEDADSLGIAIHHGSAVTFHQLDVPDARPLVLAELPVTTG